jgi:hypothetical protein
MNMPEGMGPPLTRDLPFVYSMDPSQKRNAPHGLTERGALCGWTAWLCKLSVVGVPT